MFVKVFEIVSFSFGELGDAAVAAALPPQDIAEGTALVEAFLEAWAERTGTLPPSGTPSASADSAVVRQARRG
jgi:hypothetical protein